MSNVNWALLAMVSTLLTACGPNEKQLVEQAEKKRIECLDKICEGDSLPTRKPGETVLKLNGGWYLGPQEYFSAGINGASFGWWGHRPFSLFEKLSPELQSLANSGKSDEFTVVIFLRSNNIPPEPRGYKLIELAERQGWIDRREILRPGLEAITMKHVIGPNGYSIDHVTYYVATQFKGTDGLPPVATCAHQSADGSGGTGFMWQPGIWGGTRMNQKHCADWPEIYQEITRVLQLLRKA